MGLGYTVYYPDRANVDAYQCCCLTATRANRHSISPSSIRRLEPHRKVMAEKQGSTIENAQLQVIFLIVNLH